MTYSKEIVREWLDQVAERAKDYPEWVDVFERCYTDTLDNTVEILEDGTAKVLVEPSQLSLAIGKNGQNARLAARLTGTRVDIKVLEKEEDDE